MIYDTNNLARVALDSLTDQCVSFVADFADRHTNPQPVGESGWKTTLKELRHTIPGSLLRSRDESKFFEEVVRSRTQGLVQGEDRPVGSERPGGVVV
jgi:hypothetical protein